MYIFNLDTYKLLKSIGIRIMFIVLGKWGNGNLSRIDRIYFSTDEDISTNDHNNNDVHG